MFIKNTFSVSDKNNRCHGHCIYQSPTPVVNVFWTFDWLVLHSACLLACPYDSFAVLVHAFPISLIEFDFCPWGSSIAILFLHLNMLSAIVLVASVLLSMPGAYAQVVEVGTTVAPGYTRAEGLKLVMIEGEQ
jgi:hypothetical protein